MLLRRRCPTLGCNCHTSFCQMWTSVRQTMEAATQRQYASTPLAASTATVRQGYTPVPTGAPVSYESLVVVIN